MEHPRISLEKMVNITQIEKTINSISKPDVVICERFLSDGDGFPAYQLLSKYLSWNSVIFFLVAEKYENGLVKHAMKRELMIYMYFPYRPMKTCSAGLIS